MKRIPTHSPKPFPSPEAVRRYLRHRRARRERIDTFEEQLASHHFVLPATTPRTSLTTESSPIAAELRHCQWLLDPPLPGNALEKAATTQTQTNLSWTDKYRPQAAEQVCGNQNEVDYLVDWLTRWKLPGREWPPGGSSVMEPADGPRIVTSPEPNPAVARRRGIRPRARALLDSSESEGQPSQPVSDTDGDCTVARRKKSAEFTSHPVPCVASKARTSIKPGGRRRGGSATRLATLADLDPDGIYHYGFNDPIFDEFEDDRPSHPSRSDDDDFVQRPWQQYKRTGAPHRGDKATKRRRGEGDTTVATATATSGAPTRKVRGASDWDIDPRQLASKADPTATRLRDTVNPSNSRSTTPDPLTLPNLILLVGPTGCGKTAAVFATARQCGYRILEINAGMRRNGKILTQLLGEATQSHVVRGVASSALAQGLAKLQSVAPRPTEPGPSGQGRPTATKLANQSTVNSFFKRPAASKPATLTLPRPLPSLSPAKPKNDLASFWAKPKAAVPLPVSSASAESEPQSTLPTPSSSPEVAIVLSDDDEEAGPPPAITTASLDSAGAMSLSVSRGDYGALPAEEGKEIRDGKDYTPAAKYDKPSEPEQLLILIEEVDVVFDDDRGFIAAIHALARKTKRPIILTSNRPLSAPALAELGIDHVLQLSHPPPRALVPYAALLAHREGVYLPAPVILAVCQTLRYDVRQVLNQLEVYVRGLVGSRPSDRPTEANFPSSIDIGATGRGIVDECETLVAYLTSPSADSVPCPEELTVDNQVFAAIVGRSAGALRFPVPELPARSTAAGSPALASQEPIFQVAQPALPDLDAVLQAAYDVTLSAGQPPAQHRFDLADLANTFGIQSLCKAYAQNHWLCVAPAVTASIELDLSRSSASPTSPVVAASLLPSPFTQLISRGGHDVLAELEAYGSVFETRSVVDAIFPSYDRCRLRDQGVDNQYGTDSPPEETDSLDGGPNLTLEDEFTRTVACYTSYFTPRCEQVIETLARVGLRKANPTHQMVWDLTRLGNDLLLGSHAPSATTLNFLNHDGTYLATPSSSMKTSCVPSSNTTVPRTPGFPPLDPPLYHAWPIRLVLFFPLVLSTFNTTRTALACDYATTLRAVIASHRAHQDEARRLGDARSLRRAGRAFGRELLQTAEPFLTDDPASYHNNPDDPALANRYLILQTLAAPLSNPELADKEHL
ncbi:hypothetical protein IWQ60_003333 [Tieghemiomyces parasiticus]|uniref:AAA+ ATPase domain-containing protein n=1 Tax=Tieghemiomyces parasiticus TaxID=78921 RepID=A0A9W8AAJ6_9FUNG|nr:hypothetical protein IWQ60_003333 [Tieghemiomyces parasiticus]